MQYFGGKDVLLKVDFLIHAAEHVEEEMEATLAQERLLKLKAGKTLLPPGLLRLLRNLSLLDNACVSVRAAVATRLPWFSARELF